jgi:uncharacterized ion transporter superfamily protein YfcC
MLNDLPMISLNYSGSVLSALNPFCDIFTYNYYAPVATMKGMRVIGMTIWSILLWFLLLVWYAKRIHKFSADFKEPFPYEEAREFVLKLEKTENA